MPTEWLLKLSGEADDLRELQENFSFPECCVVVEDNIYYLKSIFIKVYSVPSPEDKSAREGGVYAQL